MRVDFMISGIKVNRDLRRELQEMMEQPISDRAWTYLANQGKVQKVISGEKRLDWLEQEVLALDAAAEGKVLDGNRVGRKTVDMVQRRRAELIANRDEAISILNANEARKDPDVIALRKMLLGDKLLSPSDLEDWINRHITNDGKGPRYLLSNVPFDGEIDFDSGGTLKPTLHLTSHVGGFRSSSQTLYYGMPGDTEARIARVEHGSQLDRLRRAADALTDRFGWGHAEATIFLLTDHIPRFKAIRVTPTAYRSSMRITMSVDAIANPVEVAKAYKVVRDSTQGRVRTLTRKHLTLAVFTMDRAEDENWQRRMKAWNKAYPKHRYSSEGNFRRDSLAAVGRLRRQPGQAMVALLDSMTGKVTGGSNGRKRSKKRK
jgi:hypothetical protein